MAGDLIERPNLTLVLSGLLELADADVGCDVCFAELDRYVELELDGKNADATVPGLRVHLDDCPACAEEHESLRRLVSGERAGATVHFLGRDLGRDGFATR